MGASQERRTCAACGEEVVRRAGAGRPRDYCDVTCRRRAERDRARSRHRPPSVDVLPTGASAARGLRVLARRLEAAEDSRAPLGTRLAMAEQMVELARSYAGAAVHEARREGMSWRDVGSAGGVSEASARARWSEVQLVPLAAKAAAMPADVLTVDEARAVREPVLQEQEEDKDEHSLRSHALGQALSVLRERSGLGVREAARQADLAPAELRRILSGDHVPVWPVAHMLTTIFGGRPQEARILWEAAQGMRRPSRLTPAEAATNLRHALRGLHLAAGCPSFQEVGRASGLSAAAAAGVLSGRDLPDWPTTAALTVGLGAGPELVRGLWEEWDYARIADRSSGAALR
ncbi:helix-turn-helix domain-containing protein [Streptomyces griseocarneus]|uniref:helix-turn-helix domain-containing protein n=1 Tax=Streptomyces griseocarneus TaxID=51201 RepID=UPI00167D6015|nr:helix-turn-helix domain-containing protein [Streptomyces griseocarneus]MBZ6474083.1 helix-turn-helix domain-containing protein [Streptomyces griseocarneus]GHG52015.1 hypothetical protein GCM10018779_12710 [Streptomyces griseocarneus]